MTTMYKGIAFSPPTILAQSVNATDTTIHVESTVNLLPAPNFATIDEKETILYNQLADGLLSGCTRGIEGDAVSHTAGCRVARLFTAKDYNSLVDNVNEIEENKVEVDKALGLKANKSKIYNITALATEWVDGSQTIAVEGLKTTVKGSIGVGNNAPYEQTVKAQFSYNISIDGSITIIVNGDVPTVDIPIIILEVF